MKIGYVVNEANTEYFYFVLDPKHKNYIGIGSIVKVIINNLNYFAIVEELKSISKEEERLFDYEAIEWMYGEMKKPQYEIIGKAIFLGYIKDSKMYPEKPKTPPVPGDEVYIPLEEEIYKIYSFDDPRMLIPLGKIYLQEREFEIMLNIKNLIIRHTGIFGITGSGKSTTVAHIVNQLIRKNIPIILFDIHRDYILSYNNATIITFSKREKEFLEKLAYERNKKIKIYVGKLKLNLIEDYMEDFLGISSKQAPHVYNLLSEILGRNPKTINEMINIVKEKARSSTDQQVRSAALSLRSRLMRIRDWNLFYKDVSDEGEDIIKLLDNLTDEIINMKGSDYEEVLENENGEIIIRKREIINPNLIIVDLYPLSIEEQRMLLGIILEFLYNKYKKMKFEGKTDILGIVIEEAHRFAAKGVDVASKISLIAREGRKFGLGLILVSQIPSMISEDIISQINTFILLKIINPKDLEFIRKTCPYLSREYFEALTKLETGNCLAVGLAIKNAAILKIIKSVDVGGTEEDIDTKIIERITHGNKSNI
ncbi:MAG: ATP-binding protein [Nanopusillaceae archaeon]